MTHMFTTVAFQKKYFVICFQDFFSANAKEKANRKLKIVIPGRMVILDCGIITDCTAHARGHETTVVGKDFNDFLLGYHKKYLSVYRDGTGS